MKVQRGEVVLVDYGLAHHSREWDDRYARGFRTALHLWLPRCGGSVTGEPVVQEESDPQRETRFP
jgi:hypothetical protein